MPRPPSLRLRRPRATLLTIAALLATSVGVAGALTACGTNAAPVSTIGKVAFDKPLAIPPLATSTMDAQGRRVFELTARQGESTFANGEVSKTMGYNGSYLGPTIVANRGEKVLVHLRNALEVATTVHWHGMHLPARADGGPHQIITPGGERSPSWTIDQQASTLWYHPHPHGTTTDQVSHGLAGMFIIHDEAELAVPIPHDYGVDDIPLVVQDVDFTASGGIATANRGFVGPTGSHLLVNGVLGPYLDVTTDVTRLRLLNASASRVYNFGFSDGREFDLIGTDGGLLEKPWQTASVQLSPGERAEVLVRMAPGERVTLRSTPPDLGINPVIARANSGADSFDVLQLRASEQLASKGTVPAALVPMTRMPESSAVKERSFTLNGLQINDRAMDINRIDEVVTVGTTEIWDVENGMSMPHSFHVHDVQFQLLSVDGEAPPPELAGWKDTVYLRPEVDYRLIMHFADYTDPNLPYMYHCHMLWHEDQGMMGQFVVVKPGQAAGRPPALPAEHTANKGLNHDHH